MLARFLSGATAAAAALEFVGGVGLTSGSTQTPSFSLTGLTGGLSSAPAIGDIVIACVQFTNSNDGNITCTTSGYTEIADLYINDTQDCQLGIYYKVLTTAETSVAFNLGATVPSRFAVHVWRNPNSTNVFDATATTATQANSGQPDSPSITTVTDNAVVIAIGAAAFGPDGSSALTVPSGMENFFTARVSNSGGIAIASILRPTAGAYDPPIFGGGSDKTDYSWCAATLALRPK